LPLDPRNNPGSTEGLMADYLRPALLGFFVE